MSPIIPYQRSFYPPRWHDYCRASVSIFWVYLADHPAVRQNGSILGRLERAHGGAVLHFGKAKLPLSTPASRRFLISSAIFFKIGTSTKVVAADPMHHRDLPVVTNDMNVANIPAENSACEVIIKRHIALFQWRADR